MIGPTSRYAGLPLATLVVTGRRRTAARCATFGAGSCRRRRRTRCSSSTAPPGDRLDLLAARYLGDPTQFWRLCDATGALRPEELEVVGRVVVVGLATEG